MLGKKLIIAVIVLLLLGFGSWSLSINNCGIGFNGVDRCGKYAGDVPDIGAYESDKEVDAPHGLRLVTKKWWERIFG